MRFMRNLYRSAQEALTLLPDTEHMNALSITFGGLKSAQSRFEASARRIVSAGGAAGNDVNGMSAARGQAGTSQASAAGAAGALSPDMTRAMIDLLQAENAFKVNAKVAGRIQEMQRAYLDMASSTPNRNG